MSSDDHPLTDAEHLADSAAANWQPTRTNTVVGAVVVLAFVAVLLAASGLVVSGAVGALGGLCLALLVVAVTQTQHPLVGRVAAAGLTIPTGLLLVAGLALAARTTTLIGALVLVLGVSVATGGAIAAPWSPIKRGGLTSAAVVCLLVCTTPLLALVGYVATTTAGVATPLHDIGVRTVATLLATADSALTGYPATAVMLALLFVTTWVLRGALSSLPVVELTPAARRDDVCATVDWVTAGLRTLGRIALVAAGVCGAISIPALHASLVASISPSILSFPTVLGSATALRVLLLVVLSIALGTIVVVRFATSAARRHHDAIVRWPLSALVGVLVTVAIARFASPLTTAVLDYPRLPTNVRYPITSFLSNNDPLALGLLVCIALVAIPLAVCTLLVVLDYLVLPASGQSASLASTGLFVAALGSFAVPTLPLASFAAVAGSLLAWDVSWHAVTAGSELGRRAPTRHIELVYMGSSLLVAAVGVALASAGLLGAASLPSPTTTVAPVALVAAFAAFLLLVFGLLSR